MSIYSAHLSPKVPKFHSVSFYQASKLNLLQFPGNQIVVFYWQEIKAKSYTRETEMSECLNFKCLLQGVCSHCFSYQCSSQKNRIPLRKQKKNTVSREQSKLTSIPISLIKGDNFLLTIHSQATPAEIKIGGPCQAHQMKLWHLIHISSQVTRKTIQYIQSLGSNSSSVKHNLSLQVLLSRRLKKPLNLECFQQGHSISHTKIILNLLEQLKFFR